VSLAPLYKTAPKAALRDESLYWCSPMRSAMDVFESVGLPSLSYGADCERSMSNPNLEQLIATAALLRPILEDLVFV
jgi:hypothetical protein